MGRDIRANDPRTSAGRPSQKLPLWADFPFLNTGTTLEPDLSHLSPQILCERCCSNTLDIIWILCSVRGVSAEEPHHSKRPTSQSDQGLKTKDLETQCQNSCSGKIKTYTGTSPPPFSKKAMPWGKKWPVQMNLPFSAVKAYVPGGVQNQAEKNSKNAFRPVPVQKFTFPVVVNIGMFRASIFPIRRNEKQETGTRARLLLFRAPDVNYRQVTLPMHLGRGKDHCQHTSNCMALHGPLQLAPRLTVGPFILKADVAARPPVALSQPLQPVDLSTLDCKSGMTHGR